MANQETLQAEKRDVKGTTASKRLRREGTVPAIVYGSSQENYTIQVNSKEFYNIFKKQGSENFLVNLEIADAKEKSKLAFVQAIQRSPLTGAFIHVDFQAVSETETIHAEVAITLEGDSAGVKAGGVLEHQLHSIVIECLPADLPEQIVCNIEALEIGESIHIGEITLPSGVTTKVEDNLIIVLVNTPRVEEEIEATETPEDGEEAAEGEESAEGDNADKGE